MDAAAAVTQRRGLPSQEEALPADVPAQEFYSLLALEQVLQRRDRFKHSHERLWQDLQAYKLELVPSLEARMWDYLVLACGGEARWAARRKASHYNPHLPDCYSRRAAYEALLRYDPESLLRACAQLFNTEGVGWQGGYGGDEWHQAAVLALGRETWRRRDPSGVSWVDRVFNLEHHNGSLLDKGETGLFKGGVHAAYLDVKSAEEPEVVLLVSRRSNHLNELVRRAASLDLLKDPGDLEDLRRRIERNYYYHPGELGYFSRFWSHDYPLLGYVPLAWGTDEVPLVLEEACRCAVCDGTEGNLTACAICEAEVCDNCHAHCRSCGDIMCQLCWRSCTECERGPYCPSCMKGHEERCAGKEGESH